MTLRRLLASIVLATAMLAPLSLQAAEAKIGSIAMAPPQGWKVDQDPGARADRPSLRLQPADGRDFLVLVTPFQLAASIPLDAAGVRKLVDALATTTGPKSVEKTLAVLELKSDTMHGYYFSATDAKPAPGDWKYMTQGIALVGGNAVGFTILSNSPDSPAPAQALAMLRGAHAAAKHD